MSFALYRAGANAFLFSGLLLSRAISAMGQMNISDFSISVASQALFQTIIFGLALDWIVLYRKEHK